MLLLVTLTASPASALGVPEKLVYDVSWTGMKAGSAVLEVSAQGDELRIVNTIRSSGLVSAFFSMDDKTESVIFGKKDGTLSGLPKFFREKINEGKTHTVKEARFDFTNLRVDSSDLLKKTEKTDPISARTYDSLSSLYFIRAGELVPGESIYFDLYDFKHLWNTEVRVVKREEIRTPLGKFKTILVSTQLKFKGVPSRVGNLTVWISDDARRIPVRITTKLKLGEITMTLVGGSYWP
jgi:hypothetical protein